jgi:hypothetical protein
MLKEYNSVIIYDIIINIPFIWNLCEKLYIVLKIRLINNLTHR